MRLFRNPIVLLLADALIINGCIMATFSARFLGMIPQRNIVAYHNTWHYTTLIFILLFYVQGLYDYDEDDDRLSIFFKVFTALSFGIIGVVALTFISRDFAFPRTVLLLSYGVMLVVFSAWRVVVQEKHLNTLPRRRVVLYGDGARAASIEKQIKNSARSRFEHAGFVRDGDTGRLREAVERNGADCVIITDNVAGARSLAFDFFVKNPNVAIYLVPEVYDIIMGALHHRVLGDVPLICMSQKTILRRLLFLKRLIDISVSLVVLVPGLPVLLVAAAVVKLTSRGPVFYSQERMGRDGRLFKIIKLRTMVADAEKETGPMLSTEDDARITPAGRFFRKFKIDELPQVFNVLAGHMSLVGPRPERPEFVREFESKIPAYSERKKVLPGMTGLAQVNGYYETDAEMKLKYDLLYVYNYRPLMDLAIMYRTVQHLLRQAFERRNTL